MGSTFFLWPVWKAAWFKLLYSREKAKVLSLGLSIFTFFGGASPSYFPTKSAIGTFLIWETFIEGGLLLPYTCLLVEDQ